MVTEPFYNIDSLSFVPNVGPGYTSQSWTLCESLFDTLEKQASLLYANVKSNPNSPKSCIEAADLHFETFQHAADMVRSFARQVFIDLSFEQYYLDEDSQSQRDLYQQHRVVEESKIQGTKDMALRQYQAEVRKGGLPW